MSGFRSFEENSAGWLERLEAPANIIGAAAFGCGYLIAIVAGIWFPENAALITVLVLLGLLVGLLNVTHKEVVPYLVAAIALVLIGSNQVFTPLNLVADGLGERVNLIVRMMAIFTAPAAVIQAIRAGVTLARPGQSDRNSF
jgi:hypothetical protein